MANTKTSEEIHEEFRRVLGEQFGDAYFHTRNEWCDIWVTWNQYENLFGHGPERVELMNKAGALFFYNVDRHFFESVLLGVCRLSDPVESRGKTNLTVRLFRSFMDTKERLAKLDSLLKKVSETTEFARDWRNRRIGHYDLDLKNGTAEPLKGATRKLVSDSIKVLYKVLVYISIEFMQTEIVDEVITGYNNEMLMLDRLYLGVFYHEKELKDLKERRIIPCFERPEWLRNS